VFEKEEGYTLLAPEKEKKKKEDEKIEIRGRVTIKDEGEGGGGSLVIDHKKRDEKSETGRGKRKKRP